MASCCCRCVRAAAPVSASTRRTPEDRREDVDSILNWLRSGKKDKFDTPADDFKILDQLFPEVSGQKPEDRATDLEGALDWMRNNDVSPKEFADSPTKFDDVPFAPVSRRTPEQRKNNIADVLNWLDSGKPDKYDSTGNFKKADQGQRS